MDEAELARQMEKAELENAEIAGINTIGCIITNRIYIAGHIYEQVMTINLTWKLKEQEATMLEAEKKVAKKVAKRKRRNKHIPHSYFLQTMEITALGATPLRLHNLKEVCFVSVPKSYDDFADVITLSGVLCGLFSLINFKHALDNGLKMSFVD